MNITHICLGCFYPDGFSYQENMLPKFHKKQGHEVSVIASLQTFDKNGKTAYMPNAAVYRNEYGITVRRLQYRAPVRMYKKLKRYIGTYEAIEATAPDVLFIHGCQFMDIDKIVRYVKKHPGVTVYIDNHADFNNSAMTFASRNIMHGLVWKHKAASINPYVKKWYGVLPARVDFLRDVYALPAEKTELLVMGCDDDKVDEACDPAVRADLRQRYGIAEDDFLLITGGKIDRGKARIVDLMKAVNSINRDHVKLIVFGSVIPELEPVIRENCGPNVQYIGWVNSNETYKYFAAADLAVFPGKHSVFWEQAAGLGVPMVCTRFDGMTHVDLGGNVIFLEHDREDELQSVITRILDGGLYPEMKRIAVEKGMRHFSYNSIAERSLQ